MGTTLPVEYLMHVTFLEEYCFYYSEKKNYFQSPFKS